jgi:hypothetical protein
MKQGRPHSNTRGRHTHLVAQRTEETVAVAERGGCIEPHGAQLGGEFGSVGCGIMELRQATGSKLRNTGARQRYGDGQRNGQRARTHLWTLSTRAGSSWVGAEKVRTVGAQATLPNRTPRAMAGPGGLQPPVEHRRAAEQQRRVDGLTCIHRHSSPPLLFGGVPFGHRRRSAGKEQRVSGQTSADTQWRISLNTRTSLEHRSGARITPRRGPGKGRQLPT